MVISGADSGGSGQHSGHETDGGTYAGFGAGTTSASEETSSDGVEEHDTTERSFSDAYYVLPPESSMRRCTVFSLDLPMAASAPTDTSDSDGAAAAQGLPPANSSYLLAPCGAFPASALRTSQLPCIQPRVLCVRPRPPAATVAEAGTPASVSDDDEATAKLREIFKRILIVDDDPVCRRLNSHFVSLFVLPSLGMADDGIAAIRAMLAGAPPALLAAALKPGLHGPPDDAASTAWLARRARAGWPYDLLLCDVQMAGMDGDVCVAKLRRIGCDAVVVAVTGAVEQGIEGRLLRAGFDCVLRKPFSVDDLGRVLHKMAALVSGRRAEKLSAATADTRAGLSLSTGT